LFTFDVPFAPTLIRAELARSVGYQPDMRRSEDFVFLAKTLRRAPYAVSSDAVYAYNELGSFRREGATSRYLWASKASLRLVGDFGFSAVARAVQNAVQGLLAVVISPSKPLSMTPVRRPTPAEIEEFNEARRIVEGVAQGQL
jgi:hypothetical protein